MSKEPGFKPFLTLRDQLFGNNPAAFVAQLAMGAIALGVIYAACRLAGFVP